MKVLSYFILPFYFSTTPLVFQRPFAYRIIHTTEVVTQVAPVVTQIPQKPNAGILVNIGA